MSESIEKLPSSGVAELIEQLHQDGVKRGEDEAKRILDEAEHQANAMLRAAQNEADKIRAQAQQDVEKYKRAAESALQIAARDVLLDVKQQMSATFSEQLTRLVAKQMDDDAFVRELLVELVGKTRELAKLDESEQITLLLPDKIIGLDELRKHPEEYRDGKLSQFVQSLTGAELRQGVTFGRHPGAGIKVRLTAEDIEIDLSAESVTQLLLQHLQPRFRALIEGVIR